MALKAFLLLISSSMYFIQDAPFEDCPRHIPGQRPDLPHELVHFVLHRKSSAMIVLFTSR
jgi:hypothetical protein